MTLKKSYQIKRRSGVSAERRTSDSVSGGLPTAATLGSAFARIVGPKDRSPIYDWAARNVTLSAPILKPGLFDISGSRHFIAIFDALQNQRVREVNVLKPLGSGGSLIGDVYCPWVITNDPGPYLDVFQTEAVADYHTETRIIPVFKKCPPVAALFPINRHQLREQGILFSNGYLWECTGPSLGNLQSKRIQYLRLEEVWMWQQGQMNEAVGRVSDHLRQQTSKVLCISQAGPDDGVSMTESDWYVHYHKAQIHEWEVECPHCHKYFQPIFSGTRADGSFWGMTWTKHQTPSGDWDIPKCLPTIRFECEHCAQPILDGNKTKAEWNRTGRYLAVGELNEKSKSHHFETVIDFPWDDLVQLWLEACNAEKRGDLKPKLQFFQKRRANFKDEESLLKGGLHLARSTYEINSDWPEEKARFLTIDRQEEDLFWWTVRAWSPEKSRRLGFGKAYGFAALEKIRGDFKVQPNRTFCDSRYLPKGDQGVYAACLKYGWIAVMGDKEYHFIHRVAKNRFVRKSYAPLAYGDPESGISSVRRRCPLIRFSKAQMNQKVQELIDNGSWEEPVAGETPEMEKEYNAQMSARVKKTEYVTKTGETKVFWKESRNDHARDLANHQALGAILANLVPDPAAERLTKAEKEKETAPA